METLILNRMSINFEEEYVFKKMIKLFFIYIKKIYSNNDIEIKFK
jgi:hypothetical protein